MDEAKEPGIRIGQIFLDYATFRHRDDYLQLPPSTAPEVGPLTIQYRLVAADDESKGLIQIRALTKPESKPMYEFQVVMSMVVAVDEANPNMSLSEYGSVAGFAAVIPFLRSAIADLTSRGRFGTVWLQPQNLLLAMSEGEQVRGKRTEKARKKAKKTTKKKPAAG